MSFVFQKNIFLLYRSKVIRFVITLGDLFCGTINHFGLLGVRITEVLLYCNVYIQC
jgi:hypothetical protein